jgi:hypothetical protein
VDENQRNLEGGYFERQYFPERWCVVKIEAIRNTNTSILDKYF